MSIARYALGESAPSQAEPTVIRAKGPPKRQYIARADIKAVPEPR